MAGGTKIKYGLCETTQRPQQDRPERLNLQVWMEHVQLLQVVRHSRSPRAMHQPATPLQAAHLVACLGALQVTSLVLVGGQLLIERPSLAANEPESAGGLWLHQLWSEPCSELDAGGCATCALYLLQDWGLSENAKNVFK